MRFKQKLTKLFTNAIDNDVCEGTSSSISINPLLRKLDGIFKLKYISCAYKRLVIALTVELKFKQNEMGFPLIPFFESNVLSSVDVNNRRTAILVVAFVKAAIYTDSTTICAFF